jgi:16S rRNA (guanine966-N2)-methyltransferase
MTRIIGGTAGSLKLGSPAKVTRPTSDRIRESIFNRLESQGIIDRCRVLDLYAGTGALALEALSRGATAAVMVDSHKQAAAICENNAWAVARSLEKAGHEGEWDVSRLSVKQFLAVAAGKYDGGTDTGFDLVFIDPPYEITSAEVAENLEALLPLLNKNATVVVERSSRSETFTLPAQLTLDLRKDYGDTSVFWLELTE